MLLSGTMNLFVLFMMALLMINPVQKKKDGIETKAEFVITLRWPDNLDCDLDLWVRGPSGDIVWWQNKDVGDMHLERDDTGDKNDTKIINGKTYANPDNSEHWVLRTLIPGEYVANVHLYRSSAECDGVMAKGGLNVDVNLQKLNPSFVDVKTTTLNFTHRLQELHAFRFRLSASGEVDRIWEEPVAIATPTLNSYATRSEGTPVIPPVTVGP